MYTTPNERLKWILKELNVTPYKFSKGLNYKSPDTVYNILNGKNNICENFLFRIRLSSPYPINIEWLRNGVGEPLNHIMEIGDANEIGTKEKILYPCDLNFEFIKKISESLANAIDIDYFGESHKAEVRIAGIAGLEFKFTSFSWETEEPVPARFFSLILSPDWLISSFFDFYWSIGPLLRGQNLLKFRNNSKQIFMDAIYPIHMEIKRFVSSQPEGLIPPDFQYLKSSESFTELYITDAIIE